MKMSMPEYNQAWNAIEFLIASLRYKIEQVRLADKDIEIADDETMRALIASTRSALQDAGQLVYDLRERLERLYGDKLL